MVSQKKIKLGYSTSFHISLNKNENKTGQKFKNSHLEKNKLIAEWDGSRYILLFS